MCDSITNGGYPLSPACLPANVVIASNVLSTNGNVLCGNITSRDGTFTGNLYVSGQIIGSLVYSALNVSGTINASTFQASTYLGNGAGLSSLNASNLSFGTINSSLIFGNTLSNVSGFTYGVTITGQTTNYVAQIADYYIGCSAGITVTLPLGATLTAGKQYVIKDESGNAAVNHITIQPYTGNLIDGQTSLVLVISYGAVTLYWTGARWSIV